MATYPVDVERRRSQRTPLAVLLSVTSPGAPFIFHGQLYTVQVNDHGCLINALRPFPRGTRLRLVHLDLFSSNHTTTAHVVRSIPAKMDVQIWEVALELDKPENFWNLKSPSQDWRMQQGIKEGEQANLSRSS